MNNLEHISFNDVVNSNGTIYSSFRKTLKPSYRKAILDIFKGYFFLLLLLFTVTFLIKNGKYPSLICIPIGAFLIGYTLAYLHLFIHAAAHYNLHPNKRKNDLISDCLIGLFFGIRQKEYRKIHWEHHTGLGTVIDTEHTYFNELNANFLFKCLTGIHTLSTIKSRKKHSDKRIPFRYFFGLLLFHGSVLMAMALLGGWKLTLTWLIGLGIFFPAFAAIRQLLEHRDTKALGKIKYEETDHGKVSRLFGNGMVDSSFGAAGFNKHMIHHWDPTISYTTLPEVETYLHSCPETSSILKESKTTYFKTFLALLKF